MGLVDRIIFATILEYILPVWVKVAEHAISDDDILVSTHVDDIMKLIVTVYATRGEDTEKLQELIDSL